MPRTSRRADIGVIVALPVECAAVLAMLDDFHTISPSEEDPNFYHRGTLRTRIGTSPESYDVVVALCPKMGNNGAAMVAKDMMRTFRLKHVVMVGIAAGIPAPDDPSRHVRLGDVVVSAGKGVIQYDMTKRHPDGSLETRSTLPPPSRVLQGAMLALETRRLAGETPWLAHFARAGELGRRPDPGTDRLYVVRGKKSLRWVQVPHPDDGCLPDEPRIHSGVIGSGNCLMKDVEERDRLANELGILALEMEGAGVADAAWDQTTPGDYLVIRGICDYADRHKNDDWHAYAAVAAAAYLRALLEIGPIPRGRVRPQRERQQLIDYLTWTENVTAGIVLRGRDRVYSLPVDAMFSVRPTDLSSVDPSEAPSLDGIIADGPLDFAALWQDVQPDDSAIPSERELPKTTARRVLAAAEKVVLLGGAGSGKSTVLQFIAHTLCSSLLGHCRDVSRQLGIPGPLPIPVRIPLSAFADWIRDASVSADELPLLAFASAWAREGGAVPSLDSGFFSGLVSSGAPLLLLLDGLDEIADQEDAVLVSRQLEAAAASPLPLRLVVASRASAYHEDVLLAEPFIETRLVPLDAPEVRAMVGSACDFIFAGNARLKAERSHALEVAIDEIETRRREAHGSSSALVDTPLIVRMLLTTFLRFDSVASRRTELFRNYVRALLQPPVYPKRIGTTGKTAGVDSEVRALARLAFSMHQAGTDVWQMRDVEKSFEATPDLLRLSASGPKRLLDTVRRRGGVGEEANGLFRFAHIGIQEYLAGLHLAELKAEAGEILRQTSRKAGVTSTWWREPLFHASAILAESDSAAASNLVAALSADDTECQRGWKTSLMELDVAAEVCLEYRLSENLSRRAAGHITSLLNGADCDSQLTASERASLGRSLALLGDPRPGAIDSIPLAVQIPAGAFRMGYDGAHVIDVPALHGPSYSIETAAFSIGKYPVTNRQFRGFVECDGYGAHGRRFWTEAGWRWRDSQGIHAPAGWDELNRVDTLPVVGVSWFEAVAYCAWLSERAKQPFRLPTEAEWEKAAGGEGVWPWGDVFDGARANTIETAIGAASVVGIFNTSSRFGLFDTAGNVWEWCSSQFRTYAPYRSDDGREDPEGISPRCIRGGSWLNNKDRARAANRDHYAPEDRHFDVGFRVAETR